MKGLRKGTERVERNLLKFVELAIYIEVLSYHFIHFKIDLFVEQLKQKTTHTFLNLTLNAPVSIRIIISI